MFGNKILRSNRIEANYCKAIKLIRGFIRIYVGVQCCHLSSVFGDVDHFSGSGTLVIQQCRTLSCDAQIFETMISSFLHINLNVSIDFIAFVFNSFFFIVLIIYLF